MSVYRFCKTKYWPEQKCNAPCKRLQSAGPERALDQHNVEHGGTAAESRETWRAPLFLNR